MAKVQRDHVVREASAHLSYRLKVSQKCLPKDGKQMHSRRVTYEKNDVGDMYQHFK